MGWLYPKYRESGEEPNLEELLEESRSSDSKAVKGRLQKRLTEVQSLLKEQNEQPTGQTEHKDETARDSTIAVDHDFHPQKGDGASILTTMEGPSCLFECFHQAIFEPDNVPRQTGLTTVRKALKDFVVRTAPDREMLSMPMEEYIRHIVLPSSSGSAVEVAFLAINYGIDVVVFDCSDAIAKRIEFCAGAGRTMYLLWSGNHYDVIEKGAKPGDVVFIQEKTNDYTLDQIQARANQYIHMASKMTKPQEPVGSPYLPRRITVKKHMSLLLKTAQTTPMEDLKDICERQFKLFENSLAKGHLADALITPRSAYKEKNHLKLKGMVNLLMQLNGHAMKKIRQEFEDKDWELDIFDFVQVVVANLDPDPQIHDNGDQHQIDLICELFRQIDISGDGLLQWEEFTSHLVEMAGGEFDEQSEDVPQFAYDLIEDVTHHDYPCELVTYVPQIDRVVVFERTSRKFKLFDTNLRCTGEMRGHRGALLGITYIPEQRLLVTSSELGEIIFWECKAGSKVQLQTKWSLGKSQTCLRWSRKHNCLFSGNANGDISLWSLERGEVRMKFTGHSDVVMGLILVQNIQPPLLVSCSLDTTIRTWDLERGCAKGVCIGHQQAVVCMAYCEEVRLLISGGMDPYVLVWNPLVKNPIYRIEGEPGKIKRHTIGLEVIPGTAELVVGDNKGTFRLFDLRSFNCLQTFSIPKLKYGSLSSFTCNSYSGELIACGTKLHKFYRNRPIKDDVADDEPITLAAFNPDSSSFVTVTQTCAVKVWCALTGMLQRQMVLVEAPDTITAVCLDDRNRRLFVGTNIGKITVHNYANGSVVGELEDHSKEVTMLLYCSRTKEILSASADGSIVCHRDTEAKETALRKAEPHNCQPLTFMARSSGLQLIATTGLDKAGYTVCVFETGLGPLRSNILLQAQATHIVFLEPFPVLLVSHVDGTVSMWDLRWTPFVCIHTDSNMIKGRARVVTCMAWDLDSSTLFTGDDAGFIKIWSMESVLKSLGFSQVDTSAKFSPTSAPVTPHAALVRQLKPVENAKVGKSETLPSSPFPLLSVAPPPTTVPRLPLGKLTKAGKLPPFVPPAKESLANDYSSISIFNDDPDIKFERVPSASNHRGAASTTTHINKFLKHLDLCVKAHKEGVTGLGFVSEYASTPTIISWSSDGTVHLWDAQHGDPLGSLLQSHNSRHPKRLAPWDFHVDLAKLKKTETEFVHEALEAAAHPEDSDAEEAMTGRDSDSHDLPGEILRLTSKASATSLSAPQLALSGPTPSKNPESSRAAGAGIFSFTQPTESHPSSVVNTRPSTAVDGVGSIGRPSTALSEGRYLTRPGKESLSSRPVTSHSGKKPRKKKKSPGKQRSVQRPLTAEFAPLAHFSSPNPDIAAIARGSTVGASSPPSRPHTSHAAPTTSRSSTFTTRTVTRPRRFEDQLPPAAVKRGPERLYLRAKVCKATHARNHGASLHPVTLNHSEMNIIFLTGTMF